MTPTIDFGIYVRPVRANARSAGVLAARLERAAPEDLASHEREALGAVVACADEVRAAKSERERLAPLAVRPAFDAHTEAWLAIDDALAALTRLRHADRGVRASVLREMLFAEGVAFVRLSAPAAWSEGHRHLQRIEGEALAAELDALIGPEFLAWARESSRRLGDAVGVGGGAREIPDPAALTDALARFARAVGAYGRVLAARVDETDEGSAQRFLRAVAPIDEHRAQIADKRSAEKRRGAEKKVRGAQQPDGGALREEGKRGGD